MPDVIHLVVTYHEYINVLISAWYDFKVRTLENATIRGRNPDQDFSVSEEGWSHDELLHEGWDQTSS